MLTGSVGVNVGFGMFPGTAQIAPRFSSAGVKAGSNFPQEGAEMPGPAFGLSLVPREPRRFALPTTRRPVSHVL